MKEKLFGLLRDSLNCCDGIGRVFNKITKKVAEIFIDETTNKIDEFLTKQKVIFDCKSKINEKKELDSFEDVNF